MKLQIYHKAPYFKVKDVFGRIIDLNDYNEKRILIAFFRHAGCPFCNLRVHALTKIQPELKSKGMEMIFFFESKENVILRSSFHKGISPIPLISDPDKVWYALYGLEESAAKSAISHLTSFIPTVIQAKKAGVPVHLMESGESISTMPAEFLVGPGLVLQKVLYSERLNERLDLEEVKAFAMKK
jgi:thioredoxin-dependent peroxiredoxin